MLAMFGQSALPTQNSSYYLSGIIPPPHILNLRFFISIEVKQWAAKMMDGSRAVFSRLDYGML
jgi:hypothetical protein